MPAMRVYYHTSGCKANQYDTERMRQELEARGAATVNDPGAAEVCVLNTCTVTNQADADARKMIRRVRRRNPHVRIVVAGCSAALRAPEYRKMRNVTGVVRGQDPVEVARSATGAPPLVQLGVDRSLDRMDHEPVGSDLLKRREGATRGWLKIQDGCDRKCSFCATRLARGSSRSRDPGEVVREARVLARSHPELVLTGIHIGHYGRDLAPELTLSRLLARLLDDVPDVRFRLGSVEATEVDDLLLELLATSGGRVAPHLHMPLQSGSDPILKRMRRWHTREMYRSRALEIAQRIPVLGLGADIITGFPGEKHQDHRRTQELVEELPYTYLHVFPFSRREGTVADRLWREDPVPQRVAGERSRQLRELALEKGRTHRGSRIGQEARVVLEGRSGRGLTGDYFRVRVRGASPEPGSGLVAAVLRGTAGDPYIDLPRTQALS